MDLSVVRFPRERYTYNILKKSKKILPEDLQACYFRSSMFFQELELDSLLNSVSLLNFLESFQLLVKGEICNGAVENKGYVKSASACATECEGKKHFMVGTNRYGRRLCYLKDTHGHAGDCCLSDGSCKCYCQKEDQCLWKSRISHDGFNLFAVYPSK